ncbi:MAG: undecaprenyl-phosphate alpha-N-acetylglucosaminyl 1-phosphate transferase [Candidatus Reconcilbacillus cellulovorans]|uniref:Undecaprenyl-phosphate alpha-N-acetylglucosaminyl 1-phosphate transferase n=1 Tax=Candidatus Reconcilbacillus cellulovorans TaxID=1906605 RepID=A0A2A6E0L1_9BACL|nr:MAG: undecaprenyl-phosphate alpha-N-acetylglucosaminyl 1-phosphate transferase [Candidatus Reconcilbacillus cellulovorans]
MIGWLAVAAAALAGVLSLALTPAVRSFALRVGAVDVPNARKVHTRVMPRLGGLAIYAAFLVAAVVVVPFAEGTDFSPKVALGLALGGAVIVFIGALDDRFGLSPKAKLLGEIAAAVVAVWIGDIRIELLNVPFGDTEIGTSFLSIPLTILWIVGVTNAVNLIDGLDGLAAGVSAIANATILALAALMGNETVVLLSAALLGGTLGFLVHNFHPAKIFMGDSGALFLGFSLATLSILGFKQATLVSFVVPIVILAVPLGDTFFAIVRRVLNRRPISLPDRGHLHHCLQQLGLSHRQTVVVIYGISLFFSLCALLLSQTANWAAVIIVAVLLLAMEVGAEMIGIFSKTRRPLLKLFSRIFSWNFRPRSNK